MFLIILFKNFPTLSICNFYLQKENNILKDRVWRDLPQAPGISQVPICYSILLSLS